MTTEVEREETPVMGIRTTDDLAAIRTAWERLEEIVPLRGRKFFGVVEGEGSAYLACAEVQDGDDPESLGLERHTLPGGRYLRERLRGEPPALYDRIAPAFRALAGTSHRDESRPEIEFYRRRDEVDVLFPVA